MTVAKEVETMVPPTTPPSAGPFVPDDAAAEPRHLQVAPGNGLEPCARYPVGLPVTVVWGEEERSRSAVDVSEEGLFIESPDQAEVGSLIHLDAVLPGGHTLHALCRVERAVPPSEAAFCGGMPGMGLRFVLLEGGLGAAWEEFLVQLAEGVVPEPPDTERLEHVRRVPLKLCRRVGHRDEAPLEVRLLLDGQPGQTLVTRDISAGGLFIATDSPVEPGTRLHLQVLHPLSGRTFTVHAEVRWLRTRGVDQGMGVQFLDAEPGDSEGSFVEFVHSS